MDNCANGLEKPRPDRCLTGLFVFLCPDPFWIAGPYNPHQIKYGVMDEWSDSQQINGHDSKIGDINEY